MKDGSPFSPSQARRLTAVLLAWYERHQRDLPWRTPPGRTPDPYRVWLSEIMLQQTTVATVTPRYQRFLARWRTVEALAAAALAEVLHEWQGLGYYARARNLHRCAKAVVAEQGGRFPDQEKALRDLPGVGEYTAAAIAAIAFGRRTAPVDANIERVMARLIGMTEPVRAAKARLRHAAGAIIRRQHAGDTVQALMDLGASLCTPRRPRCLLCPWQDDCVARAQGLSERIPVKAPRPVRPMRHAVVFWLERPDGGVLLRRRPDDGLLGGLMELPMTPWGEARWRRRDAARHAPAQVRWRALSRPVEWGFTHFRVALEVWIGRSRSRDQTQQWIAPAAFGGQALPTMMKRVVDRVLAERAS
ncbi:MAG: A/G-specific adenine glycosylase [Alphaproteobacteria bacterium]|nr:A/G-specific adenine glycosylase [Alphaproteobacteria bacterium]